MTTEVWLPVVGYEGRYEVSNLGKVKSLFFIDSYNREYKERIRKTQIKNNGYEKVDLSKDGTVKSLHIHRLVAEAFLGLNVLSNDCVCHKDDNRLNNCLSNLFIGTYKDNMQDMIKKGRQSNGNMHQVKNRGEKSKRATITNEQAFLIKNKIKEGEKLINIAKDLGVSYGVVKAINLGRSWGWV